MALCRSSSSRSQSCTPCWLGMHPVSRLARAGLHTGEAQKKFSKRMPSPASRSMLGVRISLFPAHPRDQ